MFKSSQTVGNAAVMDGWKVLIVEFFPKFSLNQNSVGVSLCDKNAWVKVSSRCHPAQPHCFQWSSQDLIVLDRRQFLWTWLQVSKQSTTVIDYLFPKFWKTVIRPLGSFFQGYIWARLLHSNNLLPLPWKGLLITKRPRHESIYWGFYGGPSGTLQHFPSLV